jgi:hypothetical protein
MSFSENAGAPWRVGVLFSQTGVTSAVEQSQLNATLLAIEEINSAGGVLDRMIEPVIYDPASDPKQFRSLAERLFQVDRNDSLMENSLACFTSSKPTRAMEEAFKKSIQDLSLTICRLIARWVLYLEVTENQRRKRLSSMGLNPRDHSPAFGRDQWVASILVIIVLFLFTSIVVPGKQPFSQTFMYSVLMAIQLGMAVTRPDSGGVARGLILTLSNPGGTHFIPATAPVALRRLSETIPQMGFVHQDAADYAMYLSQLSDVAPEFGKFASAAQALRVVHPSAA